MNFFENTRKPQGFGGKLMTKMMNIGHAKLSQWGFSNISVNPDAAVLDVGCGYVNFEEFLEKNPGAKIWMATTKAKKVYTEAEFGSDDYIMFGKESAGIPEEILVDHEETCIRIPMLDKVRSLNLSNSVSIVLYEALRQNQFANMQLEGELHRLEWKD